MEQILIDKQKYLIFSLKAALMSAILLTCSLGSSFATAAEILYQNCTTAGECTGAGSNSGWTRTVQSSGCQSGSCLKLVGTLNTNAGAAGYGAGSTSINTGITGQNEITIQYWAKFDETATSISGGNFKQFIPYVGGTVRSGTIIAPFFGKDFYMSRVIGTFKPASWFIPTTTRDNNDYAVDNGDGTFTAWNGYTKGSLTAGAPAKLGTTWVKFTHYMKLPSTSSGNDGILKIWVNNELMLDFYNYKMKDSGSQTSFSNLTFFSSSEASEPFEHWMDEMIIYKGYVPPGNSNTMPDNLPAPATPEGLKED